MKALVLARGIGSRMRAEQAGAALDPRQAAAAAAGMKGLMPVGGRPFLDYVLHSLADAHITDVALVLGPEHDEVRDHYGAAPTARLSIAFVTQARPLGTADAVLAGEAWAGADPFLVLNSDNLYPPHVIDTLVAAPGPATPGFERASLGPEVAARAASYALLERAADGRLARIVEKPGAAAIEAAGPRALISMNIWRFDAQIFDACRAVPVSQRGEKELPEAVGLAVERGMRLDVIPVRGEVLDLSRRSDVAAVAARLAGRQVSL